MKNFNSTAKKLLVTSALALVSFFAGNCPVDPVIKQLNITKVSINGQAIDLTKPDAAQNNISLQPKIDITFSQNVEVSNVQDKIKLTENGTTTVIPVIITQANDSTISVSLGNNESLKQSVQYNLTITEGIEVAVGGETYKLSTDIMVKFSTISLGNDVSLSVSYEGEEISSSGETFKIPVEKSTDLTSVSLTLGVGSGSTISESGSLLSLTNNQVTQAFDFSASGNQRTFKVTAEDGTTKRTYVVSIIVRTSSSNEITSFVFSQSNNTSLTKDVNGEIEGTKISVNVPSTATRNRLVPTITHTGVSVSPASGVEQDFTGNIEYKVTSESGQARTYTVVVMEVSNSNEITGFVFSQSNNTSLTKDVNGEIEGTKISVNVPSTATRNRLVPSITHTGVSVSPASGVEQDFTGNVEYKVTSEYGQVRTYTVMVNIGYVVSYHLNGGSLGEGATLTETVLSGSKVSRPTPPTRMGYKFVNWYANQDLSMLYDFESQVSSNLDLYAKWISESAEITGISVEGQSSNFGDGTSWTLPKVLAIGATKVSFTGLSSSLGSKVVDANAENGIALGASGELLIKNNEVRLEVTAEDGKTKKVYVISVSIKSSSSKDITKFVLGVDQNTGLSEEVVGMIDGSTKAITLSIPSSLSKSSLTPTITHSGTSITPESGTSQDFTNGKTYTVTAEDKTTQAYQVSVSYVYNVTFNTGFDGATVPAQKVLEGGKVEEPGSITRSSYTFGGWYKDSNHNTLFNFNNDMVTGNLTLYAKWTLNTYTITFDSQGGTTVASQTVSHGGKVNRPDPDPTRATYTFGGWYKDSNHNTLFNFNNDVITSNTTIYAKWTLNTYTITFDSQGGTTVASQTVSHGGKVNRPDPDPTRATYTFGGWYKDSNHNTLFNFNNETVTGNLTLYAKWTLNTYTVTFNSQGGNTVASQTVSHGGKVNRPDPDPVQAGNTFGGWYKEATNTTRFDFDHDVITSNTTIYAKWTLNTYTITFDSQQGTTVASQTVSHGGKVNRPNPDPTRATYTFGGWYKDSNHNTLFNFNNETVTGNLTLYAKWTLNTYTITFDSQGGTTVASQTVSHGGKVNRPDPDPTRATYTFGGWYRESNHNTLFDFDHDVITSNITLHAKWLSSSTVLTSIMVGGKTVAFSGSSSATVSFPYGTTFPLSYSNLVKASGTTAKDANSSDATMGSTGNLVVTSGTIRIKIEALDGTAQIYTIGVSVTNPVAAFYTGVDTLGQAIKDDGLADFPVANVSNVADGSYTVVLGNVTLTKTVTGGSGSFSIEQSKLRTTNAVDDAPLTIKYGSVSPLTLAYYRSLNIYTWQDLQAMRKHLSGNYKLMKDIVFPELSQGGFPAVGFEPIGGADTEPDTEGYQGTGFTGTLDGRGKEIRGLKIEQGNALDNAGLFSAITPIDRESEDTATIMVKDLVLRDPVVKGRSFVGSLVGRLLQGVVQGVGMVGSGALVKGSGDQIGGLMGYNNGTVKGYAAGVVEGRDTVGGLVGTNEGQVEGYATGAVEGRNHVGGLVGSNNSGGTVTGYATGAVTGSGDYVGGLVGENNTAAGSGYATGAVEGRNYVGGLVGENGEEHSVTFTGYATGAVTGSGDYVGGLVGRSFYVNTVGYATGAVTGNKNVGGLMGQVYYGTANGYARSTVTRKSGSALTFGTLVGNNNRGTVNGYVSSSESTISGNGLTKDAATGVHGTAITIGGASQSSFSALTFSDGTWIWRGAGKWPAIELNFPTWLTNIATGDSQTEQP